MKYHALFVIFEKSSKIWNFRLLQIIGGALKYHPIVRLVIPRIEPPIPCSQCERLLHYITVASKHILANQSNAAAWVELYMYEYPLNSVVFVYRPKERYKTGMFKLVRVVLVSRPKGRCETGMIKLVWVVFVYRPKG